MTDWPWEAKMYDELKPRERTCETCKHYGEPCCNCGGPGVKGTYYEPKQQATMPLVELSKVSHGTIADYAKRNHDLCNEINSADHVIKDLQDIINTYHQEAKPLTADKIYQLVNALQQSWANQDQVLKPNGVFAASYNEHIAYGIYAALPPDQSARIAELEDTVIAMRSGLLGFAGWAHDNGAHEIEDQVIDFLYKNPEENNEQSI